MSERTQASATKDHRDLVIRTLADELAELRELVGGYRTLACVALECLHALTVQLDRARETGRRRRDAERPGRRAA